MGGCWESTNFACAAPIAAIARVNGKPVGGNIATAFIIASDVLNAMLARLDNCSYLNILLASDEKVSRTSFSICFCLSASASLYFPVSLRASISASWRAFIWLFHLDVVSPNMAIVLDATCFCIANRWARSLIIFISSSISFSFRSIPVSKSFFSASKRIRSSALSFISCSFRERNGTIERDACWYL